MYVYVYVHVICIYIHTYICSDSFVSWLVSVFRFVSLCSILKCVRAAQSDVRWLAVDVICLYIVAQIVNIEGLLVNSRIILRSASKKLCVNWIFRKLSIFQGWSRSRRTLLAPEDECASFETSVNVYRSTWCNNPEGRCESHTCLLSVRSLRGFMEHRDLLTSVGWWYRVGMAAAFGRRRVVTFCCLPVSHY